MPSCLASLASLTSSGQVLWHILELSCGMLMDNSNHNNEQLAKMGQIEGTLHILCLNWSDGDVRFVFFPKACHIFVCACFLPINVLPNDISNISHSLLLILLDQLNFLSRCIVFDFYRFCCLAMAATAGCQWYPRVIPLLCFCSFAPSSRRFICTSWKLRWFQMLPPPRSCRMCHHQVTSSYAHKKCCDCDAFEIQCKRASPTAILWKERSVICSISFVC